LLAFLIDHDDALAGVGDFARGDKAGKTRADHDYVRILSHCLSPVSRND
jgi:rRNA pseudouridine-1189 N-methylase Emg1 (Nep1/Mra1 family)